MLVCIWSLTFFWNVFLDCIKVFLDFNKKYNLVLIENKNKKLSFFLIESGSQPV